MFRLLTQILEQVVRSIIVSSTIRSCFPSVPLERSQLQCHWTERLVDLRLTWRLDVFCTVTLLAAENCSKAVLAVYLYFVGQRSLFPNCWSLWWCGGPPAIQINSVCHRSGRGWQQPDIHPTNVQRWPSRKQPQRCSHFTAKGDTSNKSWAFRGEERPNTWINVLLSSVNPEVKAAVFNKVAFRFKLGRIESHKFSLPRPVSETHLHIYFPMSPLKCPNWFHFPVRLALEP